MTTKKPDEKFEPKEAQRRFEAALKGARITGPKPKAAPKKAAKKPASKTR